MADVGRISAACAVVLVSVLDFVVASPCMHAQASVDSS